MVDAYERYALSLRTTASSSKPSVVASSPSTAFAIAICNASATPNPPRTSRSPPPLGVASRKLRLLRAHRLIYKVTGTHRYHLTKAGRIATTAIPTALRSSVRQLTAAAA